jgi:ferredoxin
MSSRGGDGAAARAPAARSAAGKFSGRRKVKPRLLAVIEAGCTGCAGAPVCQLYCPVDECMILVPAEDAYPSVRIWVDPLRCVGCRRCLGRGPLNALLDGCPWDTIRMVPLDAWERQHGELAY